MKKYRVTFTALMLVLCLVLGMSAGCDRGNKTDENTVDEADISNEEIEALLDLYLLHELYVYNERLSVDYSVKYSVKTNNGVNVYHKVSDEAYDTWEEWLAFCESIFTGEQLQSEMKNAEELVINVDGYTYFSPRSMGWPLSYEYSYEIVESNPDSASVKMSRTDIGIGDYPDREVSWLFHLSLTEDGPRIADIANLGDKALTEFSDSELLNKIKEIYPKAEAAYAMFTGYGTPEKSGKITEFDGITYEQVEPSVFPNLDSLREYCLDYFSESLTEELIIRRVGNNSPLYVESDESLWRFGGYAALWGYDAYSDSTEYTLLENNGDRARFMVSRNFTENGKIISAEVVYSLIIKNGELRFTDFALMAEALWEEYCKNDY